MLRVTSNWKLSSQRRTNEHSTCMILDRCMCYIKIRSILNSLPCRVSLHFIDNVHRYGFPMHRHTQSFARWAFATRALTCKPTTSFLWNVNRWECIKSSRDNNKIIYFCAKAKCDANYCLRGDMAMDNT